MKFNIFKRRKKNPWICRFGTTGILGDYVEVEEGHKFKRQWDERYGEFHIKCSNCGANGEKDIEL